MNWNTENTDDRLNFRGCASYVPATNARTKLLRLRHDGERAFDLHGFSLTHQHQLHRQYAGDCISRLSDLAD
jgi:hypothetical protein